MKRTIVTTLATLALLAGVAGPASAASAGATYDSCGVRYGTGWYAPWGQRSLSQVTAHTFALIGCPVYRWSPSWMGFR